MRIHIFISLNMCSFTLICKRFQAAGETFSSYQQDEIKLILKRARYEGLYVPNRKRNLKDLTTTDPWEILVSSRVVQSNIKTSKETEKSVPGTLQTGVYDKNAFDASVFWPVKTSCTVGTPRLHVSIRYIFERLPQKDFRYVVAPNLTHLVQSVHEKE